MTKISLLMVLILIMVAACSPPTASTPATVTAAPPSVTPSPAPTFALFITGSATPFRLPPPRLPSSVCDGAPPTYLILHERGRVGSDPQPLNIRDTAGLGGRRLGRLESGDIFMVLDGPRCSDSYTWFKIRSDRLEGWIAEGEKNKYYVMPYIP